MGSLADTARLLIETGLDHPDVQPQQRPPTKERSPEDSLRAFEVLTDLMNDLLENVGDEYPIAAVVLAHNAGVGFSRWADAEAERHGATVEQAVAMVPR